MSPSPEQAPGAERPRSTPRARVILAGGVLILIALIIGVLVGQATAAGASAPSDTSAEAGFARDMQTHHSQAVEMSLLVRDRSDDEEIRLLALDMATAQTQQMGQMYAWLVMWGLPQSGSEPTMTWMTRPALDGSGHAGHSGGADHIPGEPMPGLATVEQLQELRDADGVEAERIFLELMIAHHMGGVEMAEAALARSEHPVVTNLAAGMVAVQDKEIEYMTELLEERR